jgi:microcompartment protein CcmK/EutM
MLNFTVTSAGATALSGGNVTIDKVILYDSTNAAKLTSTDFKGAVIKDDNAGTGVGDCVVISLEDNGSASYTATKISLFSGSTEVAYSSDTNISIVKTANKNLILRISAQFDNASKCIFLTTVVNLPYATQYREGVIRIARGSGEIQKANTVYSAADIDSKLTDLGSNYVPWDISGSVINTGKVSLDQIKLQTTRGTSTNEITIKNQTGQLSIDKTLTGNVVSSSASFSSHTISGASSSYKVVNEKYIDSIYSSSVKVNNAATDKLVSGHAVNELVNGTGNDFVHKAGAETITGSKTFTGGIVANSTISGSGIYATYVTGSGDAGWENSGNETKLPTVKAVKGAIDSTVTSINSTINSTASSITSAYQAADSGLQSQIDALNAGQNLADMVATKAALDTLDTTNLQSGDKVQVLADETQDGASTVYNLTTTDPRTWTYIGKYGSDSYTKTEADNKFAESNASNDFRHAGSDPATTNQFDAITATSISSGSYSGNGVLSSYTEGSSSAGQWGYSGSNSLIPTVSAVTGYVEDYTSDNYVKLSSATVQQISSCLSVTGNISGTPALSVTGKLNVTSGNAGESTIDGGLRVDDISIARDDNISLISNTTTGTGRFQISASATSINYAGIFDGSNVSGWIEFRKGTDPVNNISASLILKEKTGSSTYTNKTAISISPTYDASTNCNGFSVTGDAVADYSDIPTNPPASPSDGRLVTVDYMQAYTGSIGNYATLSGNNVFTGSNTFNDITVTTNHSITTPTITASTSVSSVSYTGDGVQSSTSNWNASSNNSKLPTVEVVNAGITNAISSLNSGDSIGAIGLFMLVATGTSADDAKKEIGSTVSGSNLYPVGMSLPNSGQISYLKSGSARTGTWTLLSVAFRRTATEPCLVLAMKTA